MQYDASPEEANIAVLLGGVTTATLNTIANIKQENKTLSDALKESNERNKTLDAEIIKLEAEIEDLNSQIIRLKEN